MARAGEEIVAGTVNVQKGDALYGRYWGAFRPLRHLHFNVCYYAGIEHCLEHGLTRFEPGAGGEYKQLRGFDAVPTWSFHWLADRAPAPRRRAVPRARARRDGPRDRLVPRAQREPPRAARALDPPRHREEAGSTSGSHTCAPYSSPSQIALAERNTRFCSAAP